MTKLFTTGAMVAAAMIATSVSAETVTINYDGQGVKVTDSSENYDFFSLIGSGPQPMTLARNAEVRAPVGPFRPDGRADMRITSYEELPGESSAFGSVELLTQYNFPMIDAFSVSSTQNYQVLPYGPTIQRGRFATVDGELATFGAGGSDGFLVDGSFDYLSSVATVFGDDRREDLLEETDDSAILGFRIDVLIDDFIGPQAMVFDENLDQPCILPDESEGLVFDIEICAPPELVLASYFGFIEVTRGSLTPGLLGVNAFGGGAVVPNPVPLPASILLLGAGLGGLRAMRRRNKA